MDPRRPCSSKSYCMHRFVLFTILPMWQHCYCLYFKGRPLAFRARRRARMCDGIPKGRFVFGRPRPFTPPVLSLQKRVSPPSPPCTYPTGAPSHLLYLPHFRLHSPPPPTHRFSRSLFLPRHPLSPRTQGTRGIGPDEEEGQGGGWWIRRWCRRVVSKE